jgi:tetratricopeptide (TPR) repeat protein
MRLRTSLAGIAALLLTATTALAHDEHAGHESHGQVVGKVDFQNSCASEVQAELMRGVAMLHSFWFGAGEQAFRDVLAKDPSCAIADWGIASIRMYNPLNGIGPSVSEAEKAQAALAAGRATPAKTARERDYLEAVAAYYQDFASHPERERQQARAKAYEAVAARYPDDDEAQIFSALYIAGTQSQADQTYAAYAKAAAILEKQFAKTPDHPGIAHYLIHSYDAPPIAAQGLAAARRYASLAPDAPHALHMPSHIFTRVGAWEDSAATNHRSYEVAVKGGEFPEAYHASDYAVYADLQLGRDAAATSDMEGALKLKAAASQSAVAYSAAAMPARVALERGDWRAASGLPPVAGGLPFTEALTWFARGIGAARSGDTASAEADAAELAARRQKLLDAKNGYWASEVDIQQRAVSAWIAFAQHKTDDALRLMREAAELEDKNEKHIVTPGRLLPARELLGDMLFEAGQPALALKEYEASQQREPNRFRGFYGAARAAEASGDRGKAAMYYGKLLELAKNADSERPELARAREFAR